MVRCKEASVVLCSLMTELSRCLHAFRQLVVQSCFLFQKQQGLVTIMKNEIPEKFKIKQEFVCVRVCVSVYIVRPKLLIRPILLLVLSLSLSIIIVVVVVVGVSIKNIIVIPKVP